MASSNSSRCSLMFGDLPCRLEGASALRPGWRQAPFAGIGIKDLRHPTARGAVGSPSGQQSCLIVAPTPGERYGESAGFDPARRRARTGSERLTAPAPARKVEMAVRLPGYEMLSRRIIPC